MKKIVILGGSGFIGYTLFEKLVSRQEPQQEFEVVATYLKHNPQPDDLRLKRLDITDKFLLRQFLEEEKPNIIINCAALSNVDQCENDKDSALKINVGPTNVVVNHCLRNPEVKYIFFSSSQTLGETKGNSHRENNFCFPLSFYGRTKLTCEDMIKTLQHYAIIRPCVVYGIPFEFQHKNIFNHIYDGLKSGAGFTAFNDMIRSPVYVEDVVALTEKVIVMEKGGIFHAGGETLSIYDFAVKVAIFFGFEPGLIKSKSYKNRSDYEKKSYKPNNCALDSSQSEKMLNFNFRKTEEALSDIKKKEVVEKVNPTDNELIGNYGSQNNQNDFVNNNNNNNNAENKNEENNFVNSSSKSENKINIEKYYRSNDNEGDEGNKDQKDDNNLKRSEINYTGTTALVTGGAGFIGSHLVEALVEKGIKVRVLDSLIKGKLTSIQNLIDQNKVEFIEGDISNKDIVDEAMVGMDYVFHTAGIHITRSVKSPDDCIKSNIQGSYNVFSSALKHNVKRVIFSSSSSVYGDPRKLPMHEDDQLYPAEPYGAGKLFCEHLLEHLAKQGLKYNALRYYNVYGERQAAHAYYTTVVTNFIKRINNNEAPVIDGKGDQSMDFTHVSDVVRANLAAMESAAVNEVFNVGTGVSTSIKELAEIIIKALGKDIQPVFRDREVLVTKRQADTKKAAELLGFKSLMTVKEGLTAVAQEISAHPEKY